MAEPLALEYPSSSRPSWRMSAFVVRITRVQMHPDLLMEHHENRIDSAKWQRLIMNFQKLYGVSNFEIVRSKLADTAEEDYRMPTWIGEAG